MAVNIALMLVIPAIALLTTEWIARASVAQTVRVRYHVPSFAIAYLLLVCMYVVISCLRGRHVLATLLVGLAGNVPAVVTHFKLTMRGEPFLPWDLTQIGDLMAVKSNVDLAVHPRMWWTLLIFVLMMIGGFFVRFPKPGVPGLRGLLPRFIGALAGLSGCLVLLFGVFLSPEGSEDLGITADSWMQDRYYRTNGVITGFLTNLQLLDIEVPEGYSEDRALEIAAGVKEDAALRAPFYEGSYAAGTEAAVQTPDIIFVMAESFWDVEALAGIEYDQPLMTNYRRLAQEGAWGIAYTPSFGGGTCDVEFEALTGFSMEYLPAGSKPFQQYITSKTFSLPQYLKELGYSTTAIHGYGRKFWNRDTAYPRLGIDTFVASDDFVNPDKRRGFISDEAMVDRIIEEYEARQDEGPVFIHAVTMQNHTTYSRSRYPQGELVRVTVAPDTLPDDTIGQLEDCATGIKEMDAALGRLANYLQETARPTIVVFWGDHLNPMLDGHALFEETGFIEKGDTASPKLYQTPLLIWSNYAQNTVELGTLAAHNIGAVALDLYGLEQPLMFEFLMQQLPYYRARSHGITTQPDGSFDEALSEEQKKWFDDYAVLQYDYLFGGRVLETNGA